MPPPSTPIMSRRRVLVWVFGQMDKRGSFEDYALALARRARDAAVTIDFVAGPAFDPGLRLDLEAAGATLTCLPFAKRDSAWHFAKEMLRRRPTLVHCHFGSPSSVWAPVSKLLGAHRFVFTDHGSRTVIEPPVPPKFDPRRMRRRFQARFIDRFLPVSSFVGEMVMREVGAPRHRVRTLFNGIDMTRAWQAAAEGRDAIRARLGLPADARIALFVGSLCPEKGVPDLLAVQDDILAADPRNMLIWVGDGDLRDAVRATESARVLVLGRRNDVPDLTAAANLLVAPSRWYEAFSLALAEAAAAGTPVVASRIGGIPEVVADNETGLLVPPGDRAALTRAVSRLLSDPDRAARLGSGARTRAQALFRLDRMIDATIDEYSRLLDYRTPRTAPGLFSRSAQS